MMFKSYYVVWKPQHEIENFGILFCLNRTMQYGNNTARMTEYKATKWFKSYYVVWKLHTIDNKKIAHAKFKSYYVVWKLHAGRLLPIVVGGLNRTMQYGN